MAKVEPWLRGTLTEVEPVRRAVLHALELASEDAERWCAELTEAQMFARPGGIPSVAFQLLHIVRSLDRLLTYAEARALNEHQLAALQTEMDAGSAAEVWKEFRAGMSQAIERVLAILPESFAKSRAVGRQGLPTTVVGLLIHCAEHTQRHTGQMVTTAKVVVAFQNADSLRE
jgi:uncharacterized damage-inducible protein DinB